MNATFSQSHPQEDAASRRQVEIGTMISEFSGPGMTRVLRKAGFEFAIVDTEHGAFSFNDLAIMAAVTADSDFSLLVRVPSATREHIGRALDLGADGIVVPMIETVDQAQEAVRLAKYAPLGERGVSVTRAHSGYGVDDLPTYLREANQHTRVFLQLESPEAISNIEEVASVSGIYGLFMGPNDFLQSLGVAGQMEHPELHRAMRTVAAVAKRNGITSGVISSKVSLLTRARELGMTVLSLDSELGHLLRGASITLGDLRSQLSAR